METPKSTLDTTQLQIQASMAMAELPPEVIVDIALWNPSTKKYRILPSLPSDRKRDSNMCLCGARVYGLGYDAIQDDYKLVRISQFIGLDYLSFQSEVRVYSLRSNEWKRLEDMPYVLCYTRKMGILVSGCVHWVGTRNLELDQSATELVIAFDVANETFREVPMPQNMDSKCQIDVWTLKDYGVKESWSKLFTVAQPRRIKSVRPLVYSKNDREVLFEQDHECLVWFDLKSQRVKHVKVRGLPDLFEAVVCMESLVSVHPRRRDDRKQQEAAGDKKNKKRDDFLAQGFKLVL